MFAGFSHSRFSIWQQVIGQWGLLSHAAHNQHFLISQRWAMRSLWQANQPISHLPIQALGVYLINLICSSYLLVPRLSLLYCRHAGGQEVAKEEAAAHGGAIRVPKCKRAQYGRSQLQP